MDSVLVFGASSYPSTTVVNYTYWGSPPAYSTTESARRMVAPCAITLKNLYVTSDDPNPGSYTYTVVKNGVDQSLSCVVNSGSTSANDTTNSVSLAAGDVWSIKSTPAASPVVSGNSLRISLVGTCAANVSFINGGAANANIDITNTVYGGLGTEGTSTVRTDVENVMPTSGTIKNLYVDLNGAPGTAGSGKQYAFTVYKNGSAQTLTATVLNTATSSNDTTNSFTVAAGDLVAIQSIPTGTPTGRLVRWAVEFDPDTDGESVILYGNSTSSSASVSQYNYLSTGAGSWASTNDTTRASLTNAAVLKKLYVDCVTAPGASKSYDYTLQQNGASSALTVNVTGAATTTANDTTHTVTFSAGDNLSLKATPTGTPSITALRLGLVAYIAPTSTAPSVASWMYPIESQYPETYSVNSY